MNLKEHGAVRHHGAAAPFLSALHAALDGLPTDRAGVRIHGRRELAKLLGPGLLGGHASELLVACARPVRAVLFDKSAATNWALGWHQDRTVAVKARADVPGFGPWSVKTGMPHVEPPFTVIERMITIRVHLDAVSAANAPLLIAPGSHRLGRIPEYEIDEIVGRCGSVACLAERGDIWVYATPILHASASATQPARRRVLQVDFSASHLPPPLEWLGLD